MHRSILAAAALMPIVFVAVQQTAPRQDPARPTAQQHNAGRASAIAPHHEVARRAAEVEAAEIAAGKLATALLQHLVRANGEMRLSPPMPPRGSRPK
jgi:hypothetical protein